MSLEPNHTLIAELLLNLAGVPEHERTKGLRSAFEYSSIKRVFCNWNSQSAADPAQAILRSTVAHGSINGSLLHLLLAYGADLNAYDSYECTPLFMIIARCRESLVSLLIEHGAGVNQKVTKFTLDARISLIHAIIIKHDVILHLLIEKGADVNHVVSSGSPFNTLRDAVSAALNIGEGTSILLDLLLGYGAVTDWRSVLTLAHGKLSLLGLRTEYDNAISILLKHCPYEFICPQ